MADNELKNRKKGYKEFALSSLAVDNRTTVWVLGILIFLGGFIAYNNMPRESFPDVAAPEIYIGTVYPGNSPLDMEKLITRPFEKEINAISGVDEINSTSSEGYSTIQVKFDFSVSPDEALRKVKDKIDIAMSDPDFPTDLPADPNVFELNISELIPMMNINLSGDYSLDQLTDYAEELKDLIEDFKEVTSVEIRGVMDKEVEVSLDLLAMEAMEINFNDVAAAISSENVTISGGNLLVDDFRRNVRVIGEFDNVEQMGSIAVKRENQEVVRLDEIATITFGEKDKESYAREFGSPVVMLDVMKRSGSNLIEASDKIRALLEEVQKEDFPDDLRVTVTNDQSDFTRSQIDELENSIIFGIILVVGVLLFFLGLRNALFVGIAIPLSMFMSFLILGSFGVTLNTMVLFGLVLALGMLVDNGIVVVENIYRLMDEGMPPIRATKLGVGEVAVPIIASTATTVSAFLPLAFWPGLVGEFMFYLPMTLIVVLSSSLFVALVINPVLIGMFMKTEEKKGNRRKIVRIAAVLVGVGLLWDLWVYLGGGGGSYIPGNLLLIAGILMWINVYLLIPGTDRFQNGLLPKLEKAYARTIRFALTKRRPLYFLLGTVGLLVFSLVVMMVWPPKVLFFPENEPQYINIFIEEPIGTDIERTNKTALQIEERVMEILSPYFEDDNGENRSFLIESVISQVGQGGADPQQGPSEGDTPNKARVAVQFVKYQERQGVSTSEVMEEIRSGLSAIPGVEIRVSKNEAGPPQGAPISIEIKGDDYRKVMEDAVGFSELIEKNRVAGVEQLKLDVEIGKPELIIELDREKARMLNLSTEQIGSALRTALFGLEVSTFKQGEDDYPINIRLADEYRHRQDALMDMKITFRDQTSGKIVQVPISSVAKAKRTSTFSAVKRKDLDRVITITSNVITGYNPTEVVNEIRELVDDYSFHPEVEVSFTGQQEEQAEEMDFLGTALAIAVFLILFIITAQFNSVSTPFIIFAAVLLSFTGVILGLVVFRMEFIIIMTMIGLISLAGIVVNNAIVLVDYINLLRTRRKEELGIDVDDVLPLEETVGAIIQGGKTRLRPVLLTAITTVFGLIPLAIGLNINFFSLVSEFNPQIFMGGDNVMFWGPIAWTIVFGLTFSTFLTLIVVPVMYLLIVRVKYHIRERRTRRKALPDA